MLRLAADENFNQHIVTGLRRRLPGADILNVRTAGLKGLELIVQLMEPEEIESRVLRIPL